MRRVFTKRSIITLIIVFAVLSICTTIVIASSDPVRRQEANQPQPYQYAYMAATCRKGINNYMQMGGEINAEISALADQASSSASAATTQANAYESGNDASYKAALTDISNAYDQGSISYDEWSRRVDALGALPANSAQAKATAATNASKILAVAIEKIEVNRQSLKKIDENIKKLTACIDTANIYHDFNGTQVSELETIVSSSTVRP